MLSHSYSSDLISAKRHSFNENSFKLFKPLITRSQKLCHKHMSRALNPVICRLKQSPEVLDWLCIVLWIVVIPILMTIAVLVMSVYYHLFTIATFYYWLTWLTRADRSDRCDRGQLNLTKLYLLLWVNLLSDLVSSQLSISFDYLSADTSNTSNTSTRLTQLTSLLISVPTITWLLYLFGFPIKLGAVVTLMTQLCRVLSATCSQSTATTSLRPFATLVFSLIGIIVALSRESALSPVVTSGDMRLVAWRRRRSSNTSLSVPRRTSLPTLGSGNRSLGYHGNHVSEQAAFYTIITI